MKPTTVECTFIFFVLFILYIHFNFQNVPLSVNSIVILNLIFCCLCILFVLGFETRTIRVVKETAMTLVCMTLAGLFFRFVFVNNYSFY